MLVVKRPEFRLQLWRDDPPDTKWRLVREYEISIGAVGYETPPDVYEIADRSDAPDWTAPDEDWAGELRGKTLPAGAPANPIKARWLGIHDGVGIHGTEVLWGLGAAVSHGCIRLSIPDVKDLYDRVPVGTPVVVV